MIHNSFLYWFHPHYRFLKKWMYERTVGQYWSGTLIHGNGFWDFVTFWEPGETASIDPIIWIDCFKTWYSRGVVDDRPRKLFLTKLSIAWNTVKESLETYSMLQLVGTYSTSTQNLVQTKKIIPWWTVYPRFKNKWMIVFTMIGISIIHLIIESNSMSNFHVTRISKTRIWCLS